MFQSTWGAEAAVQTAGVRALRVHVLTRLEAGAAAFLVHLAVAALHRWGREKKDGGTL